jgi:hypothetical protein
MTARELVAFSWSMMTEGRDEAQVIELEEWAEEEPDVAKEQAKRRAAIAALGGRVNETEAQP